MKAISFYGIDMGTLMEQLQLPGISIAVSRGGRAETFTCGTGRFGQDYPITGDTLFQVASVSKLAFSALVMRLLDEGALTPDADISEYVSDMIDFPITLQALLSHTAGFNVHGFSGYPIGGAPISLEQVLSGAGNSPKLTRTLPAGEFSYSGGGYTLAELALARMMGKPLRALAQEKVFAPLGMDRSGYFQPLDDDKVQFAAFAGPCEDLPAGSDYMYHPEHAAAGLWSTPCDLVKLGLALGESCRSDGFLRKKTAQAMTTPVKEDYGLGVIHYPQFGADIYGHSGSNIGYRTLLIFSVTSPFAAAMCTNADDCGDCFDRIAMAVLGAEINR